MASEIGRGEAQQPFDFDVSSLVVLGAITDIVQQVRQLSRSQCDTWRRVPLHALRTQGRGGYSPKLYRAYENGLWELESSANHKGIQRASVDLASGEIVRTSDPQELADDSAVMQVAATHISELDAAKILDRLNERYARPLPPTFKSEAQLSQWHEEEAKRCRVEEMYRRQQSPAVDSAEKGTIIDLTTDMADRL